MILCGHRGVASLAPENTLAGMRKVRELGLDWVEIDVQLTRDGTPVVIHDQTVNRCTNGRGKVSNHELEQLQQLDAGSWFDKAFRNESVPTLEQLLLLCQELAIKVNIELKTYHESEADQLCHRVSQVIDTGLYPKGKLLFSSFNQVCLMLMKQLQPDLRRGLLVERIPDNWQQLMTELDCYSLHCNFRHLTRPRAQAVKQAGYPLYCYTPNQPGKVAHLIDWGVDMIITDRPQDYLVAGWPPG
ncbi:glycerophosphoryl diester phosphodiesterase [Zobellella maritima]|uniref:glycerophosphoryl diester phosphodiesterase n=1 Tax=Zobellella maritima TaxID=2059725 RepID=UPI000E308AC3|nr:glycerophosphoryl diester phosphodiesterase [Zobellella maritima]